MNGPRRSSRRCSLARIALALAIPIPIAATLVITDATPASAQTAASPPVAEDVAYSQLKQQATSELWVYQQKEPIHGFLTRLTNRDLTMIGDDDREVTIPFASITKVERSGDSIWNGFAIGALIGVAESLVLIGELKQGEREEAIPLVAFTAGVYGLIGAGIDAMHVGRTTVYDAAAAAAAGARGRRRGAAIAPSRDGRGATLSWTVRF